MQSTLDVKEDGKKVTGTLTSPQGAGPIEGEFADGKLTFSMSFDAPNGVDADRLQRPRMKADGSARRHARLRQGDRFPGRRRAPRG